MTAGMEGTRRRYLRDGVGEDTGEWSWARQWLPFASPLEG